MEKPTPLPEAEVAPNRRMHIFMRVMLWILPTGYLLMSFVGMSWLMTKFSHANSIVIVLWILSNVVFVVGAGWCDYKLVRGWVKNHYFEVTSVVMFVFLQMIYIPSFFLLIGLIVAGIAYFGG